MRTVIGAAAITRLTPRVSDDDRSLEIAAAIVRRRSRQRNPIDFAARRPRHSRRVSQIRNANRPFVGCSNVPSVDEAVEKRWSSG
jgi:hypothetical protein